MLQQYFEKPLVFQGIESADFKSYLDSFAQDLNAVGFAREHARNQLRGAAHLCVWAELQGVQVESIGEEFVSRFRLHLPECKCPGPERGRVGACCRMGVTVRRTSAADRRSANRDRRSGGAPSDFASELPDLDPATPWGRRGNARTLRVPSG